MAVAQPVPRKSGDKGLYRRHTRIAQEFRQTSLETGDAVGSRYQSSVLDAVQIGARAHFGVPSLVGAGGESRRGCRRAITMCSRILLTSKGNLSVGGPSVGLGVNTSGLPFSVPGQPPM